MTYPTPTQVVDTYKTASKVHDAVTSPVSTGIEFVIDGLLYPFVAPLLELLELAVGDPDQLDRYAEAWTRAATGLREQAAAQRADLERVGADWTGEAAQAYAAKVDELVQGLEAVAHELAQTADTLGDTATDLRNAEELIRGVIRELVEWLIVTWLAAQALAVITAGASEAAAAAASAAETGVAVSRTTMLLARLNQALKAYDAMLESLRALGMVGRFAAGKLALNRLVVVQIGAATGMNASKLGVVTGAAGSGVGMLVDAAADEAGDRLRGDDGDGSPLRRWVGGGVDPVVDGIRKPRS